MLGRGFNPRGMETCRGSIPPPLRLHSCFCGFPWLGHGEFADARHAHAGRAPKCKRKGMERNTGCRQRPYRVECTGSLPTSEVKRRRARLVLGWGTAREDLRVLSAFRICILQKCCTERILWISTCAPSSVRCDKWRVVRRVV